MRQSRDYGAPDEIYRAANGGGISIVDKFSEREILIGDRNRNKTGAAPFRCM